MDHLSDLSCSSSGPLFVATKSRCRGTSRSARLTPVSLSAGHRSFPRDKNVFRLHRHSSAKYYMPSLRNFYMKITLFLLVVFVVFFYAGCTSPMNPSAANQLSINQSAKLACETSGGVYSLSCPRCAAGSDCRCSYDCNCYLNYSETRNTTSISGKGAIPVLIQTNIFRAPSKSGSVCAACTSPSDCIPSPNFCSVQALDRGNRSCVEEHSYCDQGICKTVTSTYQPSGGPQEFACMENKCAVN